MEQDIINERNCDNIIEFSEKIKNKNFYAEHIEIYFLSKLMIIYIAIFNQKRNKWDIIKQIDVKSPSAISYVIFKKSSHEIGNHYDTFLMKNIKYTRYLEETKRGNNNIITNDILKIMIWNARSLNDITKKLFLSDIISNNTPDITVIMETFLLDDANLYIKNYKTYKTRNIEKRKGIVILIHKNLLVSVTQINNDINGRYIRLSLKSMGTNNSFTISGLYLEPNGDKNTIPDELFDSDSIIGDLNNLESSLNKYKVYQYKNVKITTEYQINKKISAHSILFGESKVFIKRNSLYGNINILDKKSVSINNQILQKIFLNKEAMKLINPHKIIKINKYKNNPKDLNLYEN
jgi:hypothetical protein